MVKTKMAISAIGTVMVIILCIAVFFESTYASETNEKNAGSAYAISSVEALKQELQKIDTENMTEDKMLLLAKETEPEVIRKFITEKEGEMDRVLGDEVLVIIGDEKNYVKKYDLGDGCWVKFEYSEQEEETIAEKAKNYLINPIYAVSKSGYKTGWQSYKGGKNYTYTAKASVMYGVASGIYKLKAKYRLTSGGIKLNDIIPSSEDSGLLRISNVKDKITDSSATTPGNSDCDAYATYKTTYGSDPIQWSKSYIMRLKIKYLAKDTVNKEIQNTREWTFKNL